MQVDTTVQLVRIGVESPCGRLLVSAEFFPKISISPWSAGEEASIIIIALEPTAYSSGFAAASGSG
jgi:hypothetical protein